jgi:hypothetical protein
MSRSYKKFPGSSDGDRCKKYQKRDASRRVRHTEDIANGAAYRKLTSPWDICDCNFRKYSWKQMYEESVSWYDGSWGQVRLVNNYNAVLRHFWRYTRK